MRTAPQCRATARSCLSDSARATDASFKMALANAAKDWDALAVVLETREVRDPGAAESRGKRTRRTLLSRAAYAMRRLGHRPPRAISGDGDAPVVAPRPPL